MKACRLRIIRGPLAPGSTAAGRAMAIPEKRLAKEKASPGARPKGTPGRLIRREKVERARRSIADPGYPPRHVLHQVAEVLVRKLQPAKQVGQLRQN